MSRPLHRTFNWSWHEAKLERVRAQLAVRAHLATLADGKPRLLLDPAVTTPAQRATLVLAALRARSHAFAGSRVAFDDVVEGVEALLPEGVTLDPHFALWSADDGETKFTRELRRVLRRLARRGLVFEVHGDQWRLVPHPGGSAAQMLLGPVRGRAHFLPIEAARYATCDAVDGVHPNAFERVLMRARLARCHAELVADLRSLGLAPEAILAGLSAAVCELGSASERLLVAHVLRTAGIAEEDVRSRLEALLTRYLRQELRAEAEPSDEQARRLVSDLEVARGKVDATIRDGRFALRVQGRSAALYRLELPGDAAGELIATVVAGEGVNDAEVSALGVTVRGAWYAPWMVQLVWDARFVLDRTVETSCPR